MFHHFPSTHTRARGSGNGDGSESSSSRGNSSANGRGNDSRSDGGNGKATGGALPATGHSRDVTASRSLVLTATLRQSFNASAFLCSAFAILPTGTETGGRAGAGGGGERGGGETQQSQSLPHHSSFSLSTLAPLSIPTPPWHHETHCPSDRLVLRKLILGRIVECLRDDLCVTLTGSTYHTATLPSMVPTQIPDPTTGGFQVM